MRYSIEEAMISLCQDKHGDTEIHWIGVAEKFNSLDNVKRNDDKKLKFTWGEVLAKQKILDKEYLDKQYQRDRATAYASVGDQLDMMMKDKRDGTTTHQTACEAVKTAHPKPE